MDKIKNKLEKQKTIMDLEYKLIQALDAYVLAIKNKETDDIKEILYNIVQKIKKQIEILRHSD